jgi:hypothetical protein
MRVFIQLDDLYGANPNLLEPIVLDLIGMGQLDPAQLTATKLSIYIVSALPKPDVAIGAAWIHPTEVEQALSVHESKALIHFGPIAPWAKNIPSFFIPLTLPQKAGQFSWFKNWLSSKRYHATIEAAHKVIALDEWHAQNRAGSKRVALEKAALPHFEWAQLAPIRSALTDGNQYLLAFVEVHDIKPIVKAFSVFKKWQLSTMSLVLVLDNEEAKQKAATLMLGYKFRDAVELVTMSDFKLEWIAAAYLTIFTAMNSHRFHCLTYTMRYQIPFLMHHEPNGPAFVLPKLAAAGEYFDFLQPDLLANHFKLYYKDEMYRAAKGVEIQQAIQAEILRFQQVATIVWPRDLA